MKIIEISGCGLCPYSSGWDFDGIKPDFYEILYCAFERKTKGTGIDKPVPSTGKSFGVTRLEYKQLPFGKHNEGLKDVPFPDWCPLKDRE